MHTAVGNGQHQVVGELLHINHIRTTSIFRAADLVHILIGCLEHTFLGKAAVRIQFDQIGSILPESSLHAGHIADFANVRFFLHHRMQAFLRHLGVLLLNQVVHFQNVQAARLHIHLLGKQIEAAVVAVIVQIHGPELHRAFQPHLLPQMQGEHIVHQRGIERLCHQKPGTILVILIAGLEQIGFLFQLDLIGLLDAPLPGGIAPAPQFPQGVVIHHFASFIQHQQRCIGDGIALGISKAVYIGLAPVFRVCADHVQTGLILRLADAQGLFLSTDQNRQSIHAFFISPIGKQGCHIHRLAGSGFRLPVICHQHQGGIRRITADRQMEGGQIRTGGQKQRVAILGGLHIDLCTLHGALEPADKRLLRFVFPAFFCKGFHGCFHIHRCFTFHRHFFRRRCLRKQQHSRQQNHQTDAKLPHRASSLSMVPWSIRDQYTEGMGRMSRKRGVERKSAPKFLRFTPL